MNVQVIRIFGANKYLAPEETATNLRILLDKCQHYGIKLIIALTNFYITSYHPEGDDGYYAEDLNGYTVLKHEWFAGGYEINYLPFVETVVSELKDHPALMAWEPGNELKDCTFANSDPQTFVDFCIAVADTIKSIDPNHLLTTGIISVENAGLTHGQAVQLYDVYDFLTTHNYDGEGDNDMYLATELNKPLIIEEAGFGGNDRGPSVQADVTKWFDEGVQGYYQWGFLATSSDNGDGDKIFGMDHIWHNDWDALFDIYKNLEPPELEENFETGDFSKHSWVQGGDADWIVTSSDAHKGVYAARSGIIADDQQSSIEVTKNVPAGYITFWCKVSSEEERDWLKFYIDSSLVDKWSGEKDWAKKSYFVQGGIHSFKWAYEKDNYSSSGSDCGCADDIIFELATLTADLCHDGIVNFLDFGVLTNYWLQNKPLADIAPPGGDGIVDWLDLAKLAEEWLQTELWY